jgi:hypothetical protein
MSLPRRPTRTLTALAITGLLLSSLVAPAFGKLVTVTVTATAVPGSVTPGKNVAIDLEFYNFPNTSNISQLSLSATTPKLWTLVGIEAPGPSQGTCTGPAGGDVSCTFGAVNAGDSVTLRVVYTTPSNVNTPVSVSLDWFLFKSTGQAGDPKGNSHGDQYPAIGSLTLDPGSDFGGAYTSAAGQVVSDNPVLDTTRNPQSTSLTSPDGLIGVTVGEVSGSTFVCPPIASSSCFGQWSVISVNSGAPYPNGFSVVLAYKGNIGNASFVHLFDDYDAVTHPNRFETITNPGDTCSSATPSASEIPCLISRPSGGNSYVTLWLNLNGPVRAD